MKIVKCGAEPLSEEEFSAVKDFAECRSYAVPLSSGITMDQAAEARHAYIENLMSFITPKDLRPLKIVENADN